LLNQFFAENSPSRLKQERILSGVAPALATFLPLIQNAGRGLPYGPSAPNWVSSVDSMLDQFGKLTDIQRCLAMERYGLSRSRIVDPHNIEIEVQADGAESMEREAIYWLQSETKRRLLQLQGPTLDPQTTTALIDSTSRVSDGWFIAYEGHVKLIKHFREQARTEVFCYAEAEALAHDAAIGGRTFDEWREACAWGAWSSFQSHRLRNTASKTVSGPFTA
jgi:hypothetical protein